MKILITGISSGLGYGLAQAYLERGDFVFGLSRRAPASALLEYSSFKFTSLDLSDFDAVSVGVPTLIAGTEELDLVILNAGILGEIRDMRDTPLSELRQIMDVNLWSNKVLLDALNSTGTKIKQVVTISSGASQSGNRGWSGYAISKAALNMLTQLYAAENPETHYAAVAPGLIDTAMQDYISTKPSVDQFPALQRLIDARGTGAMPNPEGAAKILLETFPKLLSLPSGAYADVRKL